MGNDSDDENNRAVLDAYENFKDKIVLIELLVNQIRVNTSIFSVLLDVGSGKKMDGKELEDIMNLMRGMTKQLTDYIDASGFRELKNFLDGNDD